MSDKPNCYKCKWRGEVPGDAHSCCNHPNSGLRDDSAASAFAIFASVGRGPPVINRKEAAALNVRGSPHGIRRGWFNWPYNFDPTWLESCGGFEARKPSAENARDE